MWKKWKPYIISILIALAVGGLAAFLTRGNMNVYDTLNRPPLAPPAILFPIVWGILYVLMGISAAMIYEERYEQEVTGALVVYGLQLIVNFFWSLIFFNMQAYLFATVWLALLWVLVLWMIVRFYKIKPIAAYLQIPYLVWLTFAFYLSLMVFLLN